MVVITFWNAEVQCKKKKVVFLISFLVFFGYLEVLQNAGLHSAPSQYRPINLLSVISKLFEVVINHRILGHLTKKNLLSDSQYGFRSARSTADAQTVFTQRVSQALHDNLHARAVALDIFKAFDNVWHKGLLLKLASYGIYLALFLELLNLSSQTDHWKSSSMGRHLMPTRSMLVSHKVLCLGPHSFWTS